MRHEREEKRGARPEFGGFNLGGMPCQVVYAEREPSTSTLLVRPDGTVADGPPQAVKVAAELLDAAETPLARRTRREPSLSSTDMQRFESPAQPPAGGELQKIHRLLRGRYVIAVLLALVLGGAGAFAGFRLGGRTFQSQGLITIARLELFPQADSQQSTDLFVDTQAAKLKSQGIFDAVLKDPRWQNLGKTNSDDQVAAFVKQLEVSQRGQNLVVRYTDSTPEAAQTVVQCTMDAFKEHFDKEQEQGSTFSGGKMIEARNVLDGQVRDLQQRINNIAGEYDPDALETQRTIKLQEKHDYEKAIGEVALAQAEATAGHYASAATRPAEAVTEEDAAQLDPTIASLIVQRTQARQEIATMQANQLMPEHPKLKATQTLLDALEREIADKVAQVKKGPDRVITPGSPSSLSPEQLAGRIKYLQKAAKDVDDKLADLTTRLHQINDLRQQREPIQADLSLAEQWLQKDRLQKTKWLISLTDPDRPLAPFRDTRITFAGTGGVGGLALGIGLVLLLGLSDRTVRHPSDTSSRPNVAPTLGMLPQLPDDLANPEHAAIAAHGVHEIRTLLQIWGRAQNHQVFGVTSSAAGSGKTSLVMALGISFAAARFRTLMIDCDLIGGGLTRRVDAIIRRKIGQILTRAGYITEAQLEEALRASRHSGRRLGETLVKLGYVTVQELEVAMATQADQSVGLLEALDGEDLHACTTDTGIDGLSILPLGAASGLHAGSIPPDALVRVIEQAREQFDIVLLDTGPVPGSLEASLVASNADAIVLTVAMGDRRPEVDRAITHLNSLGARLAGFVFNRAKVDDVKRYGSSRFTSSGSLRPPGAVTPRAGSGQFGPVAQAVASYAPTNANATDSHR